MPASCNHGPPFLRQNKTIKIGPRPTFKRRRSIHPEHLHHFVAEMVDHLYGDSPRFRFIERARNVTVQRRPGLLVDLGFQRGLEGLEWVVRTKEVRMADKETFLVVVGVDEPA